MFKCPGQDSRDLKAAIHPCPKCRTPVEIFSDEQRRRCSNCGTMVFAEQTPNCVTWCKAARECLGPERYEEVIRLLKNSGEPVPKGPAPRAGA